MWPALLIRSFSSGHRSISLRSNCKALLMEMLSGYSFFTKSCFNTVLRKVIACRIKRWIQCKKPRKSSKMQACQVLWHCFFFLFRTFEDVRNAFGCFHRIIQMLFRAEPILKGITSLNYPALPENWDALVDFAGIGTKNRACSVKLWDTNNKKPRNRTW